MGADGCYDLEYVDGPAPDMPPTRPPLKQMVGKRVRRGPDWKWGDQDSDGPGKVISIKDEDGILNVCWDTGRRNQYRWGYEGKYDLRIADDADIADGVNPVKVLWRSLCKLHRSLKSQYLGLISLEEPDDLQGIYNAIFQYEKAIKSAAQDSSWIRGGKRRHWEQEMRGPSCSVEHAATCLLAVEKYLLSSCQTLEWSSLRQPWYTELFELGGKEMKFPDSTGGGGGGGSQDMDKLAELLAKVLLSNS
jgi:hypothetical protein